MTKAVGSLTCDIVVADTTGLTAALLADGADGEHTSALIVALPSADETIGEVVESEPHVTLAYFGDAAGLPPIVVQALAAVCKSVAARTPEFTAKVNGKAELGDEQAKVLLLESPELSELHTALVSTGPVQIAQAGTEQFPEFIPHLTVNYGESVDALPDVEQVGFGRIALWVGDDRQEFELAGGQSFDDVMTPPKVLDEIPGFYTPEYEPVLYAAALTAAGTRKFDPSLHPRGPDGRFIKKYGIAKWLDKKSKKWGYGKVVGWAKGAAKNAVDVTLSPTDVSGVSLGQPDIVRSDTDLYDAPKVLAHLKKDDATSKKTGGQAGSNPGGFYDLGVQVEGTDAAPEIAPVPAKYYVKKAKTKQHGQNEQLANDLYSAAGVPVPMVDYDQTDGMIYSKLVGGKQDMHDHLHDDEWLTQVRRNFAVDAWLSNWDVFGATYDNVQTDVNGTVWRIDSGGALLYRAMGGAKGSDFGPDVPELKSLRAQPKNKPVYGAGMSLEDELDGANRVLAITPGQIKDLVANAGLSPSVADTLIARRKFIADHYKLDLPETLKPPDTDQPATAAPLIEPADLAKSQGLSRDWQPLTLTEAAILMRQGDRLRLPTGQTVTVGFNEDTGHPLDIIGQQNQMNALMSSFGGDADVHLNTATPGLEKPRPTHGATIKAGEVQGYRWQRGDRLMTDAGPVRVHGVAPNGTYALVSAGDGAPYTMALVGNKDYTALRWDAPATSTDVDGTEHTVTPPTDNTYGLAPAASEALQAELTVPKAATPGDKSMVLGDGTKASTGNAVLSKMDGKLYVFIKPKGPYAVVTDPNSEHPDEQLLKMASTMAQPGVAKGDLDQPKSANGIIPSVGMTAKAKDGHEGVITMVNPAGTFVFITDSTGKKKRKSTKSVEILSQEPAAPVDTTPEPIAEPETPSPETPPVAEMPEVPAVVETPAEPELEEWEKELLEAAATTGPFITDDAAAPWTQLPLSKGDQVSADGGQTWQVVHSVAPALMVTADSDGSNKQTFWNENTTPFMHQPKGLADAADVGADPEGTKVEGLLKDLDIQVGDSILDQYTGAPTWVQIEEVENGWAKGHDAKGNPSSWLLNVNDQMTAVHGPDHISAETKKTQQAEGVFDGAETDPDTDKVISIVGPGPDATPTYWVQHSPGADWQMIEDGQIKFPGVPAEMIEDNYDYTVLQEPFPTPPVPEAAPEAPVPEVPEPQVVGVKGSDYALKPGEKTQDITTVKGDEFTVVYVGGDGNSLLHPVGVVHNGKFYGSAEDLPIDTTPVGLLKFADQVPKVKAGDLLSPDGFNWYLVEQTQWKKKAGGKYNLTHYQVRSLTSGQTSEWNWHSAPTIKWKPGTPLPSGVLPPNPDAGPQTFVGMDLVSGDKVQLTGWNEGLGAGELYGQILTVQSVSPPSMYGGTGYTLVDDNGKEYLAGADALGFKVLEPTAPAAPPTVDTAADGAPKGTPSGVTGINHEPASFADFPDEVQEHLRTHPGTTVIQLSPVDKPDQFYLLDPSPEATGTLLFWNNTELIAPTKNGQQIPNGPAGLEALQKAVDQKLASGKSGHSAWTTLADVTPDDKSAPIQAPDQPAPLGDGMPELPGGYQLPPGFKAYKILDNDGEEIWVVQVDTSGNPLMPQGMIVYKLLEEDGKLDTSSMNWTEQQLIDSYDPDQLTEYVAPTPQITLKSWADATETVNGTPLNDYSKATLAAIAPNLQPGDTVWQKSYQDGTTLIVVGRSDGYHHTYSGGEIDDWAASSFNPVNLEEIAGPVAAPAPVFSTPESVDDALADLAEQLGGPPSTATPFPTPSAPLTEPPNWVFNKEFGDPDPADHYIKHFDSVWRKKPHEQSYIWYDAMDESWNPNVTAYPEEIADMANSGDPFEEWGTPPDSATPVATTTAAEFGGIAVTDGDIVIQGETGYLIKKSGDTAWHTYNLDGMEDKTVGYTDATATWAIEHADHTVVYGAFGGNVAPAGAGAGAATGVGVPSMKVTAENAVLPGDGPTQEFTKGRIQKFLDDNDGQIPDGKVLVADPGGGAYLADVGWASGGTAAWILPDGDVSGHDSIPEFDAQVVTWNVPGSATATPVDTVQSGQIGGNPVAGWAAKGVPSPADFAPGTDLAALQSGDWVFIPEGTSHGPGYFAKVSTVTPSALTAGQFVAKFTERYEVAPDGTLESNLGPGNRYLYADKPWYAVTSAVQSPELPEPEPESKAPEYPGSAKPTPAQIAAWGSDLTKDGYIPSVGMHVTGKGPMSGMIVSVNPTTSMAKVKTSDGKMSSRKVSALSVDVGANYTSYAPKAPVKDVPAGMPLAVTPPGEAIAATFATGKHHAILSDAQGVRSGAISMMRVKTPAGKSVVRVNLTLTKQQSQALIAKLKGDPNAPQPKVEPIGGWKKLSNKQSGDVAVGMKFAMKKTSSQGWLSDKNQDKPSYTVTAVDWDADGTGIVKMKHDNGDEITADFKTGFPMITYEWDPTVMPPPPPATPGHSNFTLSEQAKAMKWTHVTNEGVISAVKGGDATGNGVLDITPGQKVPTGNSAVEFLGSTDGLRKVSADGVVIEVMRPNHTATPNSWNGVTAITLPEGADEKMLAGAMADLGIDYAPMTQATAKKHARALMKSSFRFNKHDVDTPGTLTDADLFKLAADTFGVPDIGWQDIHMGVDDTIGKTTFFWSQRVRTAIAAKSKHSLVIRNGQTFQDNAAGIASNLLFGGVGGVQKRLTGMVYRTSGNMASHDAGNMANEGTFSSITTKHGDTLPQKNPHWGDWGFTVYHRPEAVLGRIGDIRAGYGDAFGNAGQDTNSVERALNTKEHQDYYIGGGTPPGSIAYIGVKSNKRRQEVIDYLAARGVTHIEGRPVADILILTSESHKYKVADLPPAKEPASSRPIEDLPVSYEQVPVESGEVEPPVTAAVDTEEAA